MAMIEHERSYVFTWDGASKFLDEHNCLVTESTDLNDYYLSCGLRVRISDQGAILTRKEGNKSDGWRIERETTISRDAADLIIEHSSLHVLKKRSSIKIDPACVERPNDANVKVVLDIIEKPMRLAILEIESVSESLYPLPGDITKRIFGCELKECPLSTTELFKRKIGVCGGPSSGKSESSKYFSHRINTEFAGNSFHVTEFATSFIQKYRRNPTIEDQFFVWLGQRDRERDASTANIVISDCPTFLSYIYTIHLNKESFSDRLALYCSKMYKRVLFDIQSYTDLIFLSIKNYKDNGVRYQSIDDALELERRVRQFLDEHRIPYIDAAYDANDRLFKDLFWINDT
jgi:nicotinamide riboside kinase